MTHPLAADTRAIIEEHIGKAQDGRLAICLSQGVDSNSLLCAALRLGIQPDIISFRMQNVMSQDYERARINAYRKELPFHPVILPVNVKTLFDDVTFIIRDLGMRKKADVECAWPMKRAIDYAHSIGITHIAAGLGADGNFGLSKNAVMERLRNPNTSQWLDDFRDAYFRKADPAQTVTLRKYCDSLGMTFIAPFTDTRFRELFRGWTWEELSLPMQKMPIRDAFPELAELEVAKQHHPLQCADSGIGKHFQHLLGPDYNKWGFKSTIGIYNKIATGEL